MTDYAELRAAMESATPGPWHTRTECPAQCCWHVFPSVELYGAGEDTPIVMGECSEADARFMALARNALPALLADRDALREVLRPLAEIDLAKELPNDLAWFVLRARAALAQEQGEKHDNQD